MDLETFLWLRSPAGQALLADLNDRDISDTSVLRELTRLRTHYSPERTRAAVEQTLLRRRARAKFAHADRLYFTREALEQATSAPVANYRAQRFAGDQHVADLCCGIGGDALALAATHPRVIAVEHDALRLAIATANAESLGLDERIQFVCGDVLETPLPPVDAIFCDPGRRSSGRRRFHVEQYEPPLSGVLALRAHCTALGVKLAPGVNMDELTRSVLNPAYELECISLDGELKEVTLWCGALATVRRRATVLRSVGSSGTTDSCQAEHTTLVQDAACAAPPLTPPRAVLYEPDPAVIRARLVAELASRLGAAQLDPTIAYLTADEQRATPFARAWRVLEWLPFSLKRLRTRLRSLDAATVTVKKRGSPLDTDALARQLTGRGTRPLVVVLTQMQGQPVALICAA